MGEAGEFLLRLSSEPLFLVAYTSYQKEQPGVNRCCQSQWFREAAGMQLEIQMTLWLHNVTGRKGGVGGGWKMIAS